MTDTFKYNLMKTSTPSLTFQSDDSQDVIDVLVTFLCEDCLQEGFDNALDDRDLKDNDVRSLTYIEYLLDTQCGCQYFLGVNDYE